MSSEQKQIREFFDRFTKHTMYSNGCWIGVWMCTGITVLMCFLPAQIMLENLKENVSLLFILVICGPMAGSFRIMPYQAYGTAPNNRRVAEVIKYHPINRTEKKKMEVFYLIRFMTKAAVVCMIAQIPVTFYEYGELSWINFVYIFMVAFAYPVIVNALSVYFEKN